MASTGNQDACLNWLFSSPVALYISEMDHHQDSAMPSSKVQVKEKTAPRPTQLSWASETKQQRRSSNSSESSVPGMVMDTGAASPESSFGGDEYHASSDAIWDSWLEDTSFSEPRALLEGHLPLRIQRSHLALPKASVGASSLTKMRSAGDLRGRPGIAPDNPDLKCILPARSRLNTTKEVDKQPPHGDRVRNRSHYTTFPHQPASRTPSAIRNGAMLEPRPERIIPSINSSLYTAPPPAEWLSQSAQPPNPPSVGDKSVFEDWDEPKATFWRRNHLKRKRRSVSDSGCDGNGNNKSPRKKGGKLWTLNLLAAVPGML